MKNVTKIYNWAIGRECRSRLQGVRSDARLVDWDPTSEAVKATKDKNLGRSPDRKQPWNPLPHLVDRKREPVRSLHVQEHLLLWPPRAALSRRYQGQCGVFDLQVHEGFVKPDPLMNHRCSRNTLTKNNGTQAPSERGRLSVNCLSIFM